MSSDLRDEKADYVRAYKAEYAAYVASGDTERATAVAELLVSLGEGPKKSAPEKKSEPVVVETADEPVMPERAVEQVRHGRARKPSGN